jgi:hypothetical protein
MKLELETGPMVKNPDAAAIRKSLAEVQGFAILSQNNLTYIQASGSAKDGFWLEYQAGSIDKHYRCPDQLSLERATGVFVSYVQADDGWKTSIQWINASNNGDLPKSISRHLWLEIFSEFAGFAGGAVIWIYWAGHHTNASAGVESVLMGGGCILAGVMIPRIILRRFAGARCPTPGCPGTAFPKGTKPITYVCKSCGCSWVTEVSESGQHFGPPR